MEYWVSDCGLQYGSGIGNQFSSREQFGVFLFCFLFFFNGIDQKKEKRMAIASTLHIGNITIISVTSCQVIYIYSCNIVYVGIYIYICFIYMFLICTGLYIITVGCRPKMMRYIVISLSGKKYFRVSMDVTSHPWCQGF